jgi:nitrate reductase (cytochrome), electron transfer subunit
MCSARGTTRRAGWRVNDQRQRGDLAARLLFIVSAVVAMAALVIVTGRTTGDRGDEPGGAAAPGRYGEPIAAEADVFRTHAGVLAIDPSAERIRAAHPRTLATYRSLRAYPGAPPRIPHGLTPDEFQTGGCNTCHERGGYSQRFGAYVPITPHPEMGACLQCHVGDGQLMAIALPGTDPSARCRQCHTADGVRWTEATLDWRPMAWPQLARVVPGREPPAIPHGLEFRGNCLACHAAPAGVAEIRTAHPERANCRQCHLSVSEDAAAFVRPANGAAGGEGD